MKLTDKQIEFMKFMESDVLPNRRKIGYDTLIHAGNMVGIPINTGCRSCASKGGMDLINLYGQLKPEYLKYLEDLKVETFTAFVPEVDTEDQEYRMLKEQPKLFPKNKGRSNDSR